jgi:hypothetical protein
MKAIGLQVAPGTNPAGNTVTIENHLVNFGAEYVFHCHILSHEEMDMMRPMVLAYPPLAPLVDASGNQITLTDSSVGETAFVVELCELEVCTEQPGSRTTRELGLPSPAWRRAGWSSRGRRGPPRSPPRTLRAASRPPPS